MNVLVFTSLYPNNVWPNQGVFIEERVSRVARLPGISTRVVAPVPYYPPLPFGWRRAYRRVLPREDRAGIVVSHPRYGLLPKVSTGAHGALLQRAVFPLVARFHRETPIDVIDAHYLYPDAYAAVRIGQALGIPVVSSARGSDVNLLGEDPASRGHVRETLDRSTRLVAVSSALRDRMVALGADPGKITVIPNGVDAEIFHPMARETARARLGLPPGPVLLSVGNLVSNKRFDCLLRALSLLGQEAAPEKRPVLVIVGGGPDGPKLRRLAESLGISDRLRLAGVIPHRELGTWYAASDLFCLATEREGWPNAILESLACGTPVIATRVGGVPEIVRSERLGLLVPGTPDDFARAIRIALDREWDRAEIARHGAAHSWDETARSARRVLEQATGMGNLSEARVAS